MSYKLRITLFYILLLFAGNAFAGNGELQEDKNLIKGTLPNGLTYYIYPNNYPKGEAVYRLFIKSGSVFEDDSQKGLAHFLEHMAFNGTEHFPGDGIIRFLESKGAKFGKDLNAHTSFNETVYKLQLPTDKPGIVDSTLMILADWAGGLLLDSMEMNKERGVILSEWLSKTGPKNDVQQAFLMELLNGSRFSQRIVIGDTAIIKHSSPETLRRYYEQWYRPDLMAIAVTGDVDAKQVEQLILQKFSGLQKPSGKKAPEYTIPDFKDESTKIIVHESLDKVELSTIQLLAPFPPIQKENDYPAYLQRTFLNRLLKARLDQLSFDDQPYTNASIGISEFLNTKGLLLASVELVPGKIESGIQAFAQNTEQMFRYGFTNLEIEKEKKKYLNQIRRKAESKSPVPSMSLMDEIYSDFYAGNKMVSAKDEYLLLQKYIDRIDSTTLISQIKKLVNPRKTHYMITAFDRVSGELPSDNELQNTFAKVRKSNIPPYHQHFSVPEDLLPKEPVAGTIINKEYLPEIEGVSVTLSNGSQVIFKRSLTDKNKIALTGFRKGGLYALDSTDFVSGAYAGNIISLSGAGKFSREALSYYLAGNTASMRFLIDRTRSGMVGGCDNQDKETMFQLLYLKWMYPQVDSAVFEQTKSKAIESYITSNKTEEDQYYRDLSYLLQGENYTNRELTDTILREELQEQRLLPVFNKNFGSANGYDFVIVGDCSFEDIEPLVLSYIGGLPGNLVQTDYVYSGGSIPKKSIVFEKAAGNTPKAKVSLVFQQDTTGSSVQMFNLEGDIMAAVLRSRLLQRLREELGMIYSVSVAASSTLYPTPLSRETISFVTSPENVQKLIQETTAQLQEMVAHPEIFERELADVKANMIKEMRMEQQKNSYWSSFIRNFIFNRETDWNYIVQYDNIVQKISSRDLAEAIQKRLLEAPMIQSVLYPKNN